MISKVLDAVEEYEMLRDTKKIAVGFSGGADSTALLHVLRYFVSEKYNNLEVFAIHINHNLRGSESVRDENFVKEFCKKNSIRLIKKSIDVKKFSKELKIGLEEAGRMMRYEIFENISKIENAKIATAHTLSDRCETLIMNLVRGSGMKGLCSIPAVRGNIIRPLINITREEIESYCMKNNLDYVNDSSNFEREYTRNKIRLDVIPRLKKINPNFENVISRTMKSLKIDEIYLEEIANRSFEESKTKNGYSISKIKKFPLAIKFRVIKKILCESMDKSPQQKHVKMVVDMIENNIKMITLGEKLNLVCKDGILKLMDYEVNNKLLWKYPISELNTLTEIKTNIIIKVLPFEKYSKVRDKNIYILDWDKVSSNAVIRNRREGDRFVLPHRRVTKTVKKLMNEFKISVEYRDKIALIADRDEVIWIDGIGVSNDYIPTKETKNIAVIYKELNYGFC